MKALNYSVLCVLLLSYVAVSSGCRQGASTTQMDSNKTWHVHTTSNGSMSISFPAKPTVTEKIQPSAIGNLQMEILQYELSRKIAFTANSITFPVSPSEYNVEAGLKGAVDGQKQNGVELIEETEITKDGLPGREVVFKDSKSGIFIRSRIYADGTGPTMYQANVTATSRAVVDGKDATKFLNSIVFNPKKGDGA